MQPSCTRCLYAEAQPKSEPCASCLAEPGMMHYTLCLITPAEALATANEMWRPLAASVPQDFPAWLEEYAAALDKLARSKL